MKRIASFLSLAVAVMVVATGCLKDKDFEAQQYGIQITEIKAVAFPNANASPLGFGLDVSASPQVVNNLLFLTLETGSNAESDINVTITNTTGTQAAGDIAAYNAAHGTNIQVLPANLWSIPFTPTIAAGQKNIMLPFTITNTTGLNPNLAYGISLTITSASSGYQVAENQKNVIVIFSVKNKYDGVYTLRGRHHRPPYLFPFEVEMHMVTLGPSSVYFYWPEVGSSGHPIGIGPNNSYSWYGGAISPVLNFDPATDLVTSVNNLPPNTVNIQLHNTDPNLVSRFEAATRTIYAYFFYTTGAGQDFNNRGWSDTLYYIGPR
jgi:hypothetical protein